MGDRVEEEEKEGEESYIVAGVCDRGQFMCKKREYE